MDGAQLKLIDMPDTLLDQRLALFPYTTLVKETANGRHLTIAGLDLLELADRFGTPLYLYDRASLDMAVGIYRASLARHFPGKFGITYAGKAYLSTAMAQWTTQHGLWLDCSGQSEMSIALAANVAREHLLMHGVNKSQADLQMALNVAGTLVVDHLGELQKLQRLTASHSGDLPELWLRLRPGVVVETHAYTQTGQSDSKFGMSFEEAAQAVSICLEARLPLSGLHFHLGSHFRDPAPVGAALQALLDFIAAMQVQHNCLPQKLCPGGGWGVAYHEDELPHPDIDVYIQHIGETLLKGCQERGLPLPSLQIEPGRSLVARAGVALYRVGNVKKSATRNWLLLDGGMADNPRHALYAARYSALPVDQPDRPASAKYWLGGPHCESGDVLIEDLPMPDVESGEIVAIPVSGAYHLSMANNYNGACRPAVVWLEQENATLIQRRETIRDLLRRDHMLPRSLQSQLSQAETDPQTFPSG